MEGDMTLGEIYDAIAEKLAEAQSRALMGEREQALGILQGAALEFTRFQDVLRDIPGFPALDQAFQTTRQALCDAQHAAETFSSLTAERPRRRTKKAA